MFPGCKIVIYDNESTDDSVKIATEAGCEVISYDTNNKLSDSKYLEIKNNCWKAATTQWVLIADIDEHLYITEQELLAEGENGVSVITSMGFNMVNHLDNMDIDSIIYGVRSESYDKVYLFDRLSIESIKYSPGAHFAKVLGYVCNSKRAYTCKHYKYVNVDYMINRHATFASRLSEENIKKGYGAHYLYPEHQIKNEFKTARLNSHVIK
jgi:hypothetical protein